MLQLGWLWPCPQILRPHWKGFPRANALAYQASSSATKEKTFNIDTRQLDFSETKLPNLILKTIPKQLLHSLPLDIILPDTALFKLLWMDKQVKQGYIGEINF